MPTGMVTATGILAALSASVSAASRRALVSSAGERTIRATAASAGEACFFRSSAMASTSFFAVASNGSNSMTVAEGGTAPVGVRPRRITGVLAGSSEASASAVSLVESGTTIRADDPSAAACLINSACFDAGRPGRA